MKPDPPSIRGAAMEVVLHEPRGRRSLGVFVAGVALGAGLLATIVRPGGDAPPKVTAPGPRLEILLSIDHGPAMADLERAARAKVEALTAALPSVDRALALGLVVHFQIGMNSGNREYTLVFNPTTDLDAFWAEVRRIQSDSDELPIAPQSGWTAFSSFHPLLGHPDARWNWLAPTVPGSTRALVLLEPGA